MLKYTYMYMELCANIPNESVLIVLREAAKKKVIFLVARRLRSVGGALVAGPPKKNFFCGFPKNMMYSQYCWVNTYLRYIQQHDRPPIHSLKLFLV